MGSVHPRTVNGRIPTRSFAPLRYVNSRWTGSWVFLLRTPPPPRMTAREANMGRNQEYFPLCSGKLTSGGVTHQYPDSKGVAGTVWWYVEVP